MGGVLWTAKPAEVKAPEPENPKSTLRPAAAIERMLLFMETEFKMKTGETIERNTLMGRVFFALSNLPQANSVSTSLKTAYMTYRQAFFESAREAQVVYGIRASLLRATDVAAEGLNSAEKASAIRFEDGMNEMCDTLITFHDALVLQRQAMQPLQVALAHLRQACGVMHTHLQTTSEILHGEQLSVEQRARIKGYVVAALLLSTTAGVGLIAGGFVVAGGTAEFCLKLGVLSAIAGAAATGISALSDRQAAQVLDALVSAMVEPLDDYTKVVTESEGVVKGIILGLDNGECKTKQIKSLNASTPEDVKVQVSLFHHHLSSTRARIERAKEDFLIAFDSERKTQQAMVNDQVQERKNRLNNNQDQQPPAQQQAQPRQQQQPQQQQQQQQQPQQQQQQQQQQPVQQQQQQQAPAQ